MAKYRLQEMPDMTGKGKKRVFPKLIVRETLDTEKLIDKLQHYNRAMPKSMVTAVMEDMAWIMAQALSEGCNVKIDGIGTFSMSADFDDDKPTEIIDEDDKMTHRKIKVRNVNFKVDQEMLKDLRLHTKFERDMGGVTRVRKSRLSLQERTIRALDIIDAQGFATLADYARATGLSESAASRDLRRICDASDSLITWKGKGSHKVWIRKVGTSE